MQKILIDACGWVAVIDSGMNFDSEISRLLGRPEVLLLPKVCLLYTSPSPRDATLSRMPSSA